MPTSRLTVTELDNRSAQFTIEPLDPGFGYSLGSALRRVLLSSIEGCAITAIRVEGVQHEFSTLPGLREDVTELMLNLRECRFVAESDQQRWEVEMNINTAGDIQASAFELPAGLELATPDLVLGHLDEGGSLQIRAVVERGSGFLPADAAAEDDPIGTIRLDANFSPVERVAYEVSAARVGQRTDYDKLTLSIYTDGTREVRDIMDEAVNILRETLNVFSPEPVTAATPTTEEPVRVPQAGMESLPIEELELGVRAFNCLKADGVETLGDLMQYSERQLAAVPNFGKKSFQEVIVSLEERGLTLKDE